MFYALINNRLIHLGASHCTIELSDASAEWGSHLSISVRTLNRCKQPTNIQASATILDKISQLLNPWVLLLLWRHYIIHWCDHLYIWFLGRSFRYLTTHRITYQIYNIILVNNHRSLSYQFNALIMWLTKYGINWRSAWWCTPRMICSLNWI